MAELLMTGTLLPMVVQLQVPTLRTTIGYMTAEQERAEFSVRLNELCDEQGIPPKGKARQGLLAKRFGVSQQAARKWLEGEAFPSIPTAKAMCEWSGCTFDWLMTGHPPKRALDRYPTAAIAQAACAMEKLPETDQWLAVRLIKQLSTPPPADPDNDTNKPAG